MRLTLTVNCLHFLGLERLKRKRDRLKKREKKIKDEIQEQNQLHDDEQKTPLPSIKLNLKGDGVFVKKEDQENEEYDEEDEKKPIKIAKTKKRFFFRV